MSWWTRDWGKIDEILNRIPGRAIPIAGAVVVLFLSSRWLNCYPGVDLGPTDDPDTPEVIEESPERFRQRIAKLEQDRKGLLNRLRGWEERGPERIIVSDTVEVPQACFPSVVVKDGSLSVPIIDLESRTGEIRKDIDIRDCDDGVSVTVAGVMCNVPRLGHLSIALGAYVKAPVSPALDGNVSPTPLAYLGLSWQKTYRSPWEVNVFVDTDRQLNLGIRRKLEVF